MFNSLLRHKILALKAFADNKSDVAEIMSFVLERVENMSERKKNAGYQHFILSHNIFKSFLFQGC